jgi:hypothetical protein
LLGCIGLTSGNFFLLVVVWKDRKGKNEKEEKAMSFNKLTLAALFSIGVLGWLDPFSVKADDAILFKVQMPGTNYCHLKFPAIREETLSSNRPVLKDATKDARVGDVIDFYGPCDYDPAGKAAVQAQRVDDLHMWFHANAD